MAILVPGPLVSSARKSIGNTTFRVVRGQQQAQKRPIPPTHTSQDAVNWKDAMRYAMKLWDWWMIDRVLPGGDISQAMKPYFTASAERLGHRSAQSLAGAAIEWARRQTHVWKGATRPDVRIDVTAVSVVPRDGALPPLAQVSYDTASNADWEVNGYIFTTQYDETVRMLDAEYGGGDSSQLTYTLPGTHGAGDSWMWPVPRRAEDRWMMGFPDVRRITW